MLDLFHWNSCDRQQDKGKRKGGGGGGTGTASIHGIYARCGQYRHECLFNPFQAKEKASGAKTERVNGTTSHKIATTAVVQISDY